MLTVFFFFNDTATTEIYTLSLHDALPIWGLLAGARRSRAGPCWASAEPRELGHESVPTSCTRMRLVEPGVLGGLPTTTDRKSTRLNSSHANISYAVFCLKKKEISHLTSHH